MLTGINKITIQLTVFAILLAGNAAVAGDSIDRANTGVPDGASVFLTYCAGCHGFDGFAAYRSAPSFSMGDRLQKSDTELLQSVLRGKGAMPSWEDKLPITMLTSAIQYLRIMNRRLIDGQPPRQLTLPGYYFRFRPADAAGPDWWMTQEE
ncbi:MAG: cytochrome c [Gammaproteobacteria bacterium]|nr:cytochrome c [Gammaproteobacteria bacterium]